MAKSLIGTATGGLVILVPAPPPSTECDAIKAERDALLATVAAQDAQIALLQARIEELEGQVTDAATEIATNAERNLLLEGDLTAIRKNSNSTAGDLSKRLKANVGRADIALERLEEPTQEV